MSGTDEVLGQPVSSFADRYVRSLLTWDILVFFYRNKDAVIDLTGLASRLGRRADEVGPEVDELCHDRILSKGGGLIRYNPAPDVSSLVEGFASACEEPSQRLALVALVLRKVGTQGN